MKTIYTRALAALLLITVLVGCLGTFAGCGSKHESKSAASSVVAEQSTNEKKPSKPKAEQEKDKAEEILKKAQKASAEISSKMTKKDSKKSEQKSSDAATKKNQSKEEPKSSAAKTEKKTSSDVFSGWKTARSTTESKTSAGLFEVSEKYKANHSYCVAVNTAQNIVIVYTKDKDGNYTKPMKAMACSAGRAGHETPAGLYTTLAKQRWLYLIDGTYGQYCTKFKEHYWFHSVPYYTQSPSDLEWPEYNKLGSNASAGCIRMCVRDVKWVYDNLGLGTVVRVYASLKREPLPKPAPVRIDTSDSNVRRGWDPTDPDPANPYH